MKRRALLLGCLGLAGCDLGPDYRRPALDIPPAFAASPANAAAAAWPAPEWWRAFKSEELNALIDRARQYNNDLAAAAARVVQADAQVRINGAPLLPSLTGTAGEAYQRNGTDGRPAFANGHYYLDNRSYNLGLQISYEADFWGKNRALFQSAKAAALATRFDEETVALTVVTSVATTYFTLLSAQDRLAVARRNLADGERILAAYGARLGAGTANALDVSQQEALVAALRANIPAFQNNLAQQRLALGILLGTPPERVNPAGGSLEALTVPDVSPGLPSELLLRRPDIAFAEAQLVAANASIRAARAAFFPDLQLTASGGLVSAALTTLTRPRHARRLARRRHHAADLRQRAAPGRAGAGQGALPRARGRLRQGDPAKLHRHGAGAGRAGLRDRAGTAGARSGAGGAALGGHREPSARGGDDRHHHLAQHPGNAVHGPRHAGAGAADPISGTGQFV